MDGIHTLDGMTPEIHPDAWVAPGARVIGRVRLLAGASVWFNAVLRGDNEWIEVGEGSNVQEGSVLHTDPGFPLTIGSGCTVGHLAILHGCTLEDECLIGMGATVLNGATVGRHSLIGAGSLVTEGKSLPPGMLAMGRPARPLRALEAGEIEGLRGSAGRYVANAARFRAGLSA